MAASTDNPFSFEFRIAAVETAAQWLGHVQPGQRPVMGFNKGQFSSLDLIRAVLDQIGPADMVLSTWTAGIQDIEHARWLVDNDQIRSMWWLVDRSFATRQPAYCARLVELFGEGSIIASNTHAKFATLRNDFADVLILTSANMNRNKRLEHFSVFVDADLCDRHDEIIGELESLSPRGPAPDGAVVEDVFSKALADASCGDVLSAEMDPRERWARLGYSFAEISLRLHEASDPFVAGSRALEDSYRQTTIAAAEAGDPKAREQVAEWIAKQRA